MSITKIKYNMAKYINKDALIAEIERLIEIANNNYAKFLGNRSAWAHQRDVCEKLLSFLDTLEVKDDMDTIHPIEDVVLNDTLSNDLEEAARKVGQKYFPNENNIWARPNYEAVAAENAFKEGAQWQKEQTIEKTCKWLEDNVDHYAYNKDFVPNAKERFIKMFRRAEI